MNAGTKDYSASAMRGSEQKARCTKRAAAAAGTAVALMTMSLPAHAVDGCLVLLCLAAPSWRAISQCVPAVTQALHDLARGRPFPTCNMAGGGNNASAQWASAPTNCPPQYASKTPLENSISYSCGYDGAITVNIDGSPWSRTWWNLRGHTVTDFSEAAKTRMGSWNTQFDDDFAAWQASLPPLPLPCPTC